MTQQETQDAKHWEAVQPARGVEKREKLFQVFRLPSGCEFGGLGTERLLGPPAPTMNQ